LVFLLPKGVGRVDHCGGLAMFISDEFWRARFCAINKAHEIMGIKNGIEVRHPIEVVGRAVEFDGDVLSNTR
jgi:hypothetical protein